MLVFLEKPPVEEYILHNTCPFDIEVRKYHKELEATLDKEPLIVKSNSKKVFVWDIRDITDRQLQIKSAYQK